MKNQFPNTYNDRIKYVETHQMEMLRAGCSNHTRNQISDMRMKHSAGEWVEIIFRHNITGVKLGSDFIKLSEGPSASSDLLVKFIARNPNLKENVMLCHD